MAVAQPEAALQVLAAITPGERAAVLEVQVVIMMDSMVLRVEVEAVHSAEALGALEETG